MRLLLLPLLGLLLLSSCQFAGMQVVRGNGIAGSRQHRSGPFARLEVSGPILVELANAASSDVRVEGDENLLEYVEVERGGEWLKIRVRDGVNLHPKAGITVYIATPSLEEVAVDGSGEVKSASLFSAPSFRTSIAGSGTIELKVDAPEVASEIAGSGTVKLSGTTKDFRSEIAGSGDLYAFDLLSETTSVSIAGSGDARVFASKDLKVDITGSGDVRYKGSPRLSQTITGSGDIHKAE